MGTLWYLVGLAQDVQCDCMESSCLHPELDLRVVETVTFFKNQSRTLYV